MNRVDFFLAIVARNRRQRDYQDMVLAGASPRLAEMLATQTPPGLQTDTRFLHGRHQNGFYSHQLQSFVSSRADVKRICAEKNYHCEGSVSHKAEDRSMGEQPYRVADDIVQDAVLDVLDEHPTALKDDPGLPAKLAKKLSGGPGSENVA